MEQTQRSQGCACTCQRCRAAVAQPQLPTRCERRSAAKRSAASGWTVVKLTGGSHNLPEPEVCSAETAVSAPSVVDRFEPRQHAGVGSVPVRPDARCSTPACAFPRCACIVHLPRGQRRPGRAVPDVQSGAARPGRLAGGRAAKMAMQRGRRITSTRVRGWQLFFCAHVTRRSYGCAGNSVGAGKRSWMLQINPCSRATEHAPACLVASSAACRLNTCVISVSAFREGCEPAVDSPTLAQRLQGRRDPKDLDGEHVAAHLNGERVACLVSWVLRGAFCW